MATYRFTRANVENTVNMIYDFIVEYIQREGYPPAVRDICNGVGIKSTSTIHGHLKRLQESGRIEYTAGKRRAITVPEVEGNRVIALPVIGQVTAGVPILAQENIERTLPLPAEYFSDDGDVFALKIRGDSMIGAAILDGDYVIVRKQSTATPGDIIVALIGDEATVKTLANENGKMFLQPENPAYEPIPFDHADCQVLGKVCGVFRTGV
ncbi:MAG: transcriptional repressor LexA [Eubacteriales bacterium]|nr:transcriptional repressor LexA [Eubacteriales bacterium]MDD3867523.1 transcriptional repressor LexA [Eubacteriales bacterium]MDD4461785.1 transcriptional repressor LexA [Eubacteriales bacterium]